MKKKKLLAVALCIGMTGAMALTGCGSSGKGANAPANDSEGGSGATGGYVFRAKGVEIAVDMDMSAIEDSLGEPESSYEEPSCAAQGTARLLTYAGFEINTYPDGEKDLVGYIILKDDTVATPEGVDLSMTKAEVLSAYGEKYTEKGTALVYEKGGMKLSFIFDGENIASIQYSSSVMD